jgi:DNA-binding transcriptional MerR regulator
MAVTARKSMGPRRVEKSAAAFRTISEVAEELDVPQHVLRFWETRFPPVRPLKRGGGRRYYRPEDIDLLRRIRDLLYDQGYTIKGVQRLLREGALKVERALEEPNQPVLPLGVEEPEAERAPPPPRPTRSSGGRLAESQREAMLGLLADLIDLRDELRSILPEAK